MLKQLQEPGPGSLPSGTIGWKMTDVDDKRQCDRVRAPADVVFAGFSVSLIRLTHLSTWLNGSRAALGIFTEVTRGKLGSMGNGITRLTTD